MTDPREAVARVICGALDRDWSMTHRDDAHWTDTRGMIGAVYCDFGLPTQADYLAAARAAIAAYEAAQWQPIETAPRVEGGLILGYQSTAGDHFRRVAVCLCLGGMYFGDGGLMPTHWRPLPEPPKGETK